MARYIQCLVGIALLIGMLITIDLNSGNGISGIATQPISYDATIIPSVAGSLNVAAVMCRTDDCEGVYIEAIMKSSQSIYCAFFDFDLYNMNDALSAKKVDKIVYVDGDNRHFNDSYIIYENKSSYMHNKFCIFDNKVVITGSFNPTYSDERNNDNNILIISSEEVARIYSNYFRGLIGEHLSNYTKRSIIKRNYELAYNNANLSICFSRGGECSRLILRNILDSAQSVKFLTFSMTDEGIADSMIIRHYLNLSVEGVMEKTLIGQYSMFDKLAYHNVSVQKDCNPKMMHHKVFVMDNMTVVTGSFNPGSNAENSNDENLVVLQNREIAEKYLKEFDRVREDCNGKED